MKDKFHKVRRSVRLRNLKNEQEFERLKFCHNHVDLKINKRGGCDHLQGHVLMVRLRDLAQSHLQIFLGDTFYKALMTRGEPNPVL